MSDRPQLTSEMLEIVKILTSHKYKALVLYLVPESKQPEQEVLQLLSEMAVQGYLCFVCFPSDSNSANGIEAKGQNFYLIHNGFSVISLVRNLSAIVLSTQDIHADWGEVLSHKFLWFYANSASDQASAHQSDCHSNEIINQADLISYHETNPNDKAKFFKDSRAIPLKTIDKNHNWAIVEKKIKFNPKGWQVYANINLQNKIAVMTATFFDFEGEFFYSGGAERYLLDLGEICEELGRQLVIFQYGNYPWMRRFKNIDIVSLSRSGQKAEGWVLKCGKAFNRVFYELVQNRTDLNIYSAFFEAWPFAATPNIGISHGVAWDNPYCTFETAYEFWVMNERHIQGAKACQEMVSVDTNSANWFQTVDYELGQRTKVIPNYVDLSLFRPREDYLKESDKRIVLYPRQFYMGRGLYLVLEILDDILEKYPDVEFHFVGRGGLEDTSLILEKQQKWHGKVKCYPQSMEEMPQVYQTADISLIPSVHSEGTSLSCLEAMASGNAIIASRVGGLSDLIINNYNGLLIDPQPDELKKALIDLLDHPKQMTVFKEKSLEVAQAFSKTSWQDRWKTLLKAKLETATDDLPSDPPNKSRVVEIRLKNELADFEKLGNFITGFLIAGWLVYIRSKEIPDRALSFARVQWLRPDFPLFSPYDLYVEW